MTLITVCIVDLALLLDDSGSIKDKDRTGRHWDELITFTKLLVDRYKIGKDFTRLAGM